ncbi:MAG TPA: hypothetical protein VFH61_04575 [Thermoleophilia bacterium]|nr:hypothetical protein [Thermoleophilia bacterium]
MSRIELPTTLVGMCRAEQLAQAEADAGRREVAVLRDREHETLTTKSLRGAVLDVTHHASLQIISIHVPRGTT